MMVIHLGFRLLGTSSGTTQGNAGQLISLLFGLAPGEACQAPDVTTGTGGLLPHRFTLTPIHRTEAVCFLLR